MHKDLDTIFTDNDWLVIYLALASLKEAGDNGYYPGAVKRIEIVMNKVHEFIDDAIPAVVFTDTYLMFNRANTMGEE